MKRLITKIAILSFLFSVFSLTVCFAEEIWGLPLSLNAETIEEFVEFIETEDGETYLSWMYEDSEDPKNTKVRPGHRTTLPFYRERGHIVDCYFPEESSFYRNDYVLGNDFSEPFISYRFVFPLKTRSAPAEYHNFYIHAVPINEQDKTLLETEGLLAYCEKNAKIGNSQEENTVTIGSGETVSYLHCIDDYLYNDHVYGNEYVYFVYHEDMIIIELDLFMPRPDLADIFEQLHLKIRPIEKKPLNPGYGRFLNARYTINDGSVMYEKIPEMASLETLQQNVAKYLNEFYKNEYYEGYEWELLNEEYIPAVAATADDPNGGTNGSYSFQIKMTDSANRSFISRTFTETIKPSKFIGFDAMKVEGNEVSVDIVQYNPTIGMFYIAFYQDNLCLEQRRHWTKNETEQTYSETIPEGTNRIKVFLWGETFSATDFATGKTNQLLFINPLCSPMELTKNEQGEWE
ncbi:MAG: hypothetical protein E7399_05495 [Ruminococcaceae bacterium]|nr:hypothetical protein [Oscillospiraceae bacterium]